MDRMRGGVIEPSSEVLFSAINIQTSITQTTARQKYGNSDKTIYRAYLKGSL